jgi:hypothetical protein
VLLELLDNLLLVRDGEGGGVEDVAKLGVLLEDALEGAQRLAGSVEGVGFRGGRVLAENVSQAPLAAIDPRSIPMSSPRRQFKS